MESEDKHGIASIEAMFSVVREMPYLYQETAKGISERHKEPTAQLTVLNTSDKIAHLDPKVIRKIEEELRLTYVRENRGGDNNVCMANSPEVRDEYKDVFNAKDLLDYIYAALHSSRNCAKYSGSLKTDFFQIPYPDDQKVFWKLVGLGAQLLRVHLFKAPPGEKYSTAINKITENIDEIEIGEIRKKGL